MNGRNKDDNIFRCLCNRKAIKTLNGCVILHKIPKYIRGLVLIHGATNLDFVVL
jgi:hypothetical protein